MKPENVKPILLKSALPLSLSFAGIIFSLLLKPKTRDGQEEQSASLSRSQSSNSLKILALPDAISEVDHIEMEEFEDGSIPEEDEITSVKNQLTFLREKQEGLEARFLSYMAMKEQESALKEVQRELELDIANAELLGMKVESMEAEYRSVAEYLRVGRELEQARSEVALVRRKMKEVLKAKKQCFGVARKQAAARRMVEEGRRQEREEFEERIEKLREISNRLESEKKDMVEKFEFAVASAQSTSKIGEEAATTEPNQTTPDNTKLMIQLEQLQNERLSNLQELIHLRWNNACLRYELLKDREGLITDQEEKGRELVAESEEHEKKGICAMGYEPEGCSVLMEDGGRFKEEVARHGDNSTKPVLFQKLKRWVRKKEKCRKPPLSDDEEHRYKCYNGCSFYDGAIEDLARNSC